MTVRVHLEGATPYAPAHALMEALVAARRAGEVSDTLLLLTHPETITLGRRKEAAEGVVAPGDVPVVPIERGGEATWHGPGQLVGYPIVALDGGRRDVHAFLHGVEQGVIDLLADLGVSAGRDDRNTGVWIDGRKVCSIGIALRQWVTWHGLALNVDADLGGFARIRPCGFTSDTITRLVDHLDPCPSVADLKAPLGEALVRSLSLDDGPVLSARLAGEDDVAGLVARVASAGVPG